VEPDATQPAQPSQESATATEPLPVEGAAADATASGGGFAAATLDELRRVVWPSRQQLFSESVAVILMVGLSAAAIAAIDRFFGWVASQLFR
jgi:preprotein translocase subunit SecE